MADGIYTRRDFVSAAVAGAFAVLGGVLLTACAPKGAVTPATSTGTGAESTGTGTGSPAPSESQPPDILSKFEMPHYPGSVERDKFTFKWPGIEQYLVDAVGATWAYYSSNDAPTKVATFFREQTKQEPYLKRELMFVDGGAMGFLSVFADDSLKVWIRVWSTPQPADSSKTNIAVSVEDTSTYSGT